MACALLLVGSTTPPARAAASAAAAPPAVRAMAEEFCVGCHNARRRRGKLDLASLLAENVGAHPQVWSEVLGKLRGREMPPKGEPRPDDRTYEAVIALLEASRTETARVDPGGAVPASPALGLVDRHCTGCHNGDDRTGGLDLDRLLADDPGAHPETWEKVVRRLRARQMPPAGEPRPEEPAYESLLASLEGALDAAAAARPDPGRTSALRRLNRTEYQNAIRDLLALDVDSAALLPPDEISHGFDNAGVAQLSPVLLERHVGAAQKISRLAVGGALRSPGGHTFRIPPDRTQEQHVPGLPFGTRGGALLPYTFPQDGEYDVRIRLARDRNEEVEGLSEPHRLELLLDRERVGEFTVEPPPDPADHTRVDAHLETRIPVSAGPHELGVTFAATSPSLVETRRQPYQAHFNMHRHPRLTPAVYQVSITGPFAPDGRGDTPSQRRIFVCRPEAPAEEEPCAERILATLLRRAYRRPVTDADVAGPLAFYREARGEAGFDAGIEAALSAVLVSPQFLFRVERDPDGVAPGRPYRVSDLELASRLSFFLWSSIPDDELLDAAVAGRLSRPDVLEQQVRRMLADPRSTALVTSFAAQWLHLRNLEAVTPDLRLFPDFDDNLRQAMRRETELLFESLLREDRSVLDLLRADYTFLDERLAKHYGIPHVYGSRFRRVPLDADSHRGGLLRHGSVLAVTSYATRTSPVLRGKWVLENILGTPPPPPPPDVPDLKDDTVSAALPMRERLAAHRENPACAGCHRLMDPAGFALENYDAVGRWRDQHEGHRIDASGGLPDGSAFDGVAGLERAVLERPGVFVGVVAERLLTYALGRGLEYYDAPAVRRIVREAQAEDYRLSALIRGVVFSLPFTERRAP